MTASEGKNGNWYFHCGDCGRFLSVGDPKPITDGMGFEENPRFPEDVPGLAGEPIRSVGDAICKVHGVVEEGAFLSSTAPRIQNHDLIQGQYDRLAICLYTAALSPGIDLYTSPAHDSTMKSTSELLRKAKEAGIDDLLEAEILVYYLKAAGGDIDKAIFLAEAGSLEVLLGEA